MSQSRRANRGQCNRQSACQFAG